mgnify:CR=1 FL=1
MFSNLFGGIFDSSTVTVIPVYQFLLCVVVSLLLGIVLAAAYTYKSKYNAGFVRTLAILPAVVCIVIMMVNGNVGTGVAVAGAFSLVRFRSVPGSAKRDRSDFIAMGSRSGKWDGLSGVCSALYGDPFSSHGISMCRSVHGKRTQAVRRPW